MRLVALPAFQDNYIWLLCGADGAAVVVDPGDDAPVRAAMAEGIRPVALLLTHHHADHVGGAARLQAALDIPAYGPVDDRIPGEVQRVGDGDRVDVPALGVGFDVMAVPGHTRSHVAFHGAGHLFCGDTLFSLGCGRMFEGQPAQMLASLERLAALPGDTALCCGHEYTEANGRFARTVEPDNPAREAWLARVGERRRAGLPSLPGTLAVERDANPFLRVDTPAVRATLAQRLGQAPADRAAAFAALREWKDGFTG
ncbi:MAG TPA: hydroxyacylglutathione hydrolase [Arenimonas sp.]|uniref:hydroxyacylglutathione hydrolase n=1 Tax=Arenimonas sp. TaxID=1872635 RepID=UPI002D805C98|nr:hydroxyacylglutathione hydrolase [Arenimonas sp.]HEU0154385.1 hydroxyacylglutathione hydrolase [Arenimonas sp.]